MRKAFITMLGVLLWAAPALAQSVTYEKVTFADASTGFTSTTIRPTGEAPMTVCWGKLETAQIRTRVDGTAPTTAEGEPVDVGEIVTISGYANLVNFRGIRTGSTSGVIAFQCSR